GERRKNGDQKAGENDPRYRGRSEGHGSPLDLAHRAGATRSVPGAGAMIQDLGERSSAPVSAHSSSPFVNENSPHLFPEFSAHDDEAGDKGQVHGGENVDALAGHGGGHIGEGIGRQPAREEDREAGVVSCLGCRSLADRAPQGALYQVGEVLEIILSQQGYRKNARDFRAAGDQEAGQNGGLRRRKPEPRHRDGAERHDERQGESREPRVEAPVSLEGGGLRCVHCVFVCAHVILRGRCGTLPDHRIGQASRRSGCVEQRMPPPTSDGMSKGTGSTVAPCFSISLISRLCSAPMITTPGSRQSVLHPKACASSAVASITSQSRTTLGNRPSCRPCMKQMHSPSRMTAKTQSRWSHSVVNGTRCTR